MTKKQLQIREQLNQLILTHNLFGKLSFDMVVDWVLNAHGTSVMEASNAYQKKCFAFFRRVKDLDEMNRILQIFVDVWNYFPHKDLGGKSPHQMVAKVYGSKTSVAQSKKNDDAMPDVICGGRKYSWDAYQAMLKECERVQKPFRAWIENHVLPSYKKFIQGQYKSEQAREKHAMIADIFFERVLHLGFVRFDLIYAKFVWDDFPAWWQTHVMHDHQTEDQIRNALFVLSMFLQEVYGKGLPTEEI